MINHEFNIDERISILEKQLEVLKQEQNFLNNIETDDIRQRFIDMNRLCNISLEILSKEDYLNKLKESIKRDLDDVELEYKQLNIDELMKESTSMYDKLDPHNRNKLQYLENELLAYEEKCNKEAVVFYKNAIKNLIKRCNS
jgi:hypothetical protein